MKRPQKKYKSEAEIIRLMDANADWIKSVPEQIESSLAFAKSLAVWLSNAPPRKNAAQEGAYVWIWNREKQFREDAEKFERGIPRRARKLEFLKQKLSEFRTMTLPGVVNDDSVV